MSNAFLGPDDILDLQADLEDSLFDQGDTVNLWERTRTKDDVGAIADSWRLVEADIPALIGAMGGARGEVAQAESNPERVEVALPGSRVAQPGNQLRTYDGRVYSVDGTNVNDTIRVMTVCTCTRVDQPDQDADLST